MVKGKAKPVQAWAIGEVLGSRTRNASAKLPLIGRDKELAELRAALADAAAGKGSLIEIVGEPGIGKTRLVEELHADQEARVLFAAAEAFTASTRTSFGVSFSVRCSTSIGKPMTARSFGASAR